MNFASILIYDSTQKVDFDYFFAVLVLLLLVIGIYLVRAARTPDISRIRPGIFTMIRLFILRNPKKNKLYGRIAIGASAILIFTYISNYMALKDPGRFHDIISITGRIEDIRMSTRKSTEIMTLRVNSENFHLAKDKGYVASKQLTAGDSITIDYYMDTNRLLTADEKKRIVKLIRW